MGLFLCRDEKTKKEYEFDKKGPLFWGLVIRMPIGHARNGFDRSVSCVWL
jgi:hypothetical protein